VRRSSCEDDDDDNDDDVPLNLSLSSGPQHRMDSEPRRADSDPPCTTSVSPPGVDGAAWRRSVHHNHHDNHRDTGVCDEMDSCIIPQHRPSLRRHESSPCFHPELRKSSSAGTVIIIVTILFRYVPNVSVSVSVIWFCIFHIRILECIFSSCIFHRWNVVLHFFSAAFSTCLNTCVVILLIIFCHCSVM